MRTSPLWMLALVPWVSAPPAHAPVAADMPRPCALAIELRVKAPLAMGTLELRVMAGVEPAWAPYSITFCWGSSQNQCEGLEVRVRVLTIEDTAVGQAGASRTRSWISN